MFDVRMTDTFQYQNQFVDTDNITWWDEIKNAQITDKTDFISVTHEDETILLVNTQLICTLVRDLILLSLNHHNLHLQNCRYSIFPHYSVYIYNISYIIWYLRFYSHNTITIYKFHFTFLCMDDVWSLNNSKFHDYGDRILKWYYT